jgi:uncharacterized protein YkwD
MLPSSLLLALSAALSGVSPANSAGYVHPSSLYAAPAFVTPAPLYLETDNMAVLTSPGAVTVSDLRDFSNSGDINNSQSVRVAASRADDRARQFRGAAFMPSIGGPVRQQPEYSPNPPFLAPSQSDTVTLSTDEEDLYNLVNRDRENGGLAPLTLDPLLTDVARGHSKDMDERSYFDHIEPGDGQVSPMDRYLAAVPAHPQYALVGENIYYRSQTDSLSESADQSNTAFMHSPGHRANIMDPRYTKVGIGIHRDQKSGQFWVTEMFLRDAR